jgi:hypothetical protein
VKELYAWYADGIEERLAAGVPQRQAHWTESLAVGDHKFIEGITSKYRQRVEFSSHKTADNAWCIREGKTSYGTATGPQP